MKTVELLRAIRQYDERKDALAQARVKMERVLSILGAKWGFDETGFYHIPLFVVEENYLVEAISGIKKAHAAFEDLFVDHQALVLLEMMRQEMKARQEIDRFRLEYITGVRKSAREVL